MLVINSNLHALSCTV